MGPSKLRLLIGVAGAVVVLAACQQILGLGDFKDCTEVGATCDGGAEAGVDADLPDGGRDAETDADAGPVFPQGSKGSDWLDTRMGYVDGGVVDGAGSTNPSVFAYDPNESDFQVLSPTDAGGNRAVVDSVTKRTWLVISGSTTTAGTFAAANEACANRAARVATRIELVSILDPTQTGGAGMVRPEVVAPGVPPVIYWSSTAVRATDGTFSFWTMDFKEGKTQLKKDDGSTFYGVLCIFK